MITPVKRSPVADQKIRKMIDKSGWLQPMSSKSAPVSMAAVIAPRGEGDS